MRRLLLIIVSVLVLGFTALLASGLRDAMAERDRTAITAVASATIERWLGPQEFEAFGGPLSLDFGVTESGAAVFRAGPVLRLADPARAALPRTADVTISTTPDSFALDVDGTMLTTSEGYFGAVDDDDRVLAAVPLPYAEARLAPSVHEGATYLFGSDGTTHRGYRFIDDGTFQILAESPEPLVAMADDESNIYAATARTIVRVRPGAAEVLFRAPDTNFVGPIRSLAVSTDGIVFFSTDTKVYALLGQHAMSVVNNAGGAIRIRGGVLYVLDPQRRMLFTMRPASGQLFSGGTS